MGHPTGLTAEPVFSWGLGGPGVDRAVQTLKCSLQAGGDNDTVPDSPAGLAGQAGQGPSRGMGSGASGPVTLPGGWDPPEELAGVCRTGLGRGVKRRIQVKRVLSVLHPSFLGTFSMPGSLLGALRT